MKVLTGQKTFNFGLKAKSEDAPKVEAAIKNHADWMRNFHSYDDSKIQLVHFYVAKSDEYNNPANPAEGTTGHVVYSINEVYVHPEGIQQHFEQAKAWSDFPSFLKTLQEYGQIIVAAGEVIETL